MSVVSPAEAEHGLAEFGSAASCSASRGSRMLVLRIEPRSDGAAVMVNAHSLAAALARAKLPLESS